MMFQTLYVSHLAVQPVESFSSSYQQQSDGVDAGAAGGCESRKQRQTVTQSSTPYYCWQSTVYSTTRTKLSSCSTACCVQCGGISKQLLSQD